MRRREGLIKQELVSCVLVGAVSPAGMRDSLSDSGV